MITLIYLPATVVSVSKTLPIEEMLTYALSELLLDAICDSGAEWKSQLCGSTFQRMALRRYMHSIDDAYSAIMVGVGPLSITSKALGWGGHKFTRSDSIGHKAWTLSESPSQWLERAPV